MLNINIKRIEHDLLELAKFGAVKGGSGVTRQAFTPDDMASRKWFMEKLEAEGFTARMDGAGNVIGRYGAKDLPTIVMGSHLDSVPEGGIFDGTLGVMVGLECMRTLKENNTKLNCAIEVIGTQDEEGRFGGMFGAQALSGEITLDWIQQARSAEGEKLTEAMHEAGLDPMQALHARLDPAKLKAFLEIHIEQGPVLEAERKEVGVVTGIAGVFNWSVRLKGRADHSGTAPMHLRKDAFVGLADFAHQIPRIIDEDGTDLTRITIGRVELKPGFPHTVPGEAEFTIVGRDMDADVMQNIATSCRKALSAIARRHDLMFEYEELSWLDPQLCDDSMIKMLEDLTDKRGYKRLTMPSGAGHDAQFFTQITPTGMLFVPSVNGVSHSPEEWSRWDDIEKGSNVLLDALIKLGTK
tara:strand:- start:29807 stop:31039 length:1233 start_codon:yes stop_codon:yes gene_type:complete